MRSRPFGPSRAPVSVIGQGTWNLEQAPRRQAIDALRAGLDAGMGHIDTAEMYGSGEVERIVGEAIAGRREEVALAFLIRHQNVFAIPKTASRARAVENARAAEVTLSEEEIAKIEQAFPKGKPPRRLPTI